MVDLAAIALALPGVEEGVACAGTKLESRVYTAGKKSFLFVSSKEVRLKLAASAQKAKALGFTVGANGWVKLPLDALPAATVLRRWIGESYALASAGSRQVVARSKPRASAKKKGR